MLQWYRLLNVVQWGNQWVPSHIHPHSAGSRYTEHGTRHCHQIWPAWYVILWTCCNSESWVGKGVFFRVPYSTLWKQVSCCTIHDVMTACYVVQGYCIRTVHTKLVVLAVATVNELNSRKVLNIRRRTCVAFGTGKNFRYVVAHSFVTHLAPQQSRALSVMHALTGCDTVSSYYGKGKQSPW